MCGGGVVYVINNSFFFTIKKTENGSLENIQNNNI